MGNKKWIVYLSILFVFQFVPSAYILNKLASNISSNHTFLTQISNKVEYGSMPVKQILEAFNSTYKIAQYDYFKNPKVDDSRIEEGFPTHGSGILLRGGYFLTAGHVVKRDHRYDFSRYFITNKSYKLQTLKDEIYQYELKYIFSKSEESNSIITDYSLLKLKEEYNLTFYSEGLNFLGESSLREGLISIITGWPIDLGRNLRKGHLSQLKSDVGSNFLTFSNSLLPSDSGCPVFIVYNGKLYFIAVGTSIASLRGFQGMMDPTIHPTTISYGIKLTAIIEDLKKELKSSRFGRLDKDVEKEIKNFLKLNMR